MLRDDSSSGREARKLDQNRAKLLGASERSPLVLHRLPIATP